MLAEHGRGRLAQRAGLHVLGEVDHLAVLELQVDHHLGAAQLGDLLGRGVGRGKPSGPGHVGRELQDPGGIEVVDHRPADVGARCCSRHTARARSLSASPKALNASRIARRLAGGT